MQTEVCVDAMTPRSSSGVLFRPFQIPLVLHWIMVKRGKPSEPADSVSVPPLSSSSRSLYWSGAHTTHRLRFHLVWVPKYRRRVLEGAIATRLTELLQQACVVNAWELHELSVQPDHVHLLLQIPPRFSVSKVVNLLKGGSSRLLRKEFADLEEFLWGDSFWCDGYFAETVGQTEEGVIRRYIRNQGGIRD